MVEEEEEEEEEEEVVVEGYEWKRRLRKRRREVGGGDWRQTQRIQEQEAINRTKKRKCEKHILTLSLCL